MIDDDEDDDDDGDDDEDIRDQDNRLPLKLSHYFKLCL